MDVSISIKIPEELKKEILKSALKNDRNLSGEIRAALKNRFAVIAPPVPKYPLMPPAYPLPSTNTPADPEPLLPVGWND
jgi:hypothetical protein